MNTSDPSPKLSHLDADSQRISLIFDHSLTGWQNENLRGKLLRAGIAPAAVNIHSLDCLPDRLDRTIVGFGERTLRQLTDKRSVDKWALSPLRTGDGSLFIPTYDYVRVNKQYELNLIRRRRSSVRLT